MSFATEGFSAMMSFLAISYQNAHKPIIGLVSAATVARGAQVLDDEEIPCHAVTISADAANERHTSKAQNDKSNPRRQARNDVVRGQLSERQSLLEA
jgi:hypothetical protein